MQLNILKMSQTSVLGQDRFFELLCLTEKLHQQRALTAHHSEIAFFNKFGEHKLKGL